MEKKINAPHVKCKKAFDAIESLRIAIENMKNVSKIAKIAGDPEELYKIFRDSLIQRFEYTFDLIWKNLCEYLESEGRKIKFKTPKAVFRESLKSNYLSEDEARLAIKMVNHRNLTTNGYDEELIEEIRQQIPKYYELMNGILQKIVQPS
ncbi:hypothetical protein HOD08_03185 [bacterium]|jgi:nucleotidyltransferase substrate binding protein (TIGR01987 family)|nr:hypothetical protein [bacterium]